MNCFLNQRVIPSSKLWQRPVCSSIALSLNSSLLSLPVRFYSRRNPSINDKKSPTTTSAEKGLKLKPSSGVGSRVAPRFAAAPKPVLELASRIRTVRKKKQEAHATLPARLPVPLDTRTDKERMMQELKENPNQPAPPKYLKITQVKGTIDLGKSAKSDLESLGLRKRLDTVYLEPTRAIVGKCIKHRYILKISRADEIPPPFKHTPGFEVLGQYAHPWSIKAATSKLGKGPFIE